MAGVIARTAAELANINKTTAAYYFHRLRLLTYQNSPNLEMFNGEVEADESYFGGARKRQARSWCKRQNRSGIWVSKTQQQGLYGCGADETSLLIRKQVKPDSIVYTDF